MSDDFCWYLFDMDSTLSDDSWRIHLWQQGKYDEYHELAAQDEPNAPVAATMRAVLSATAFESHIKVGILTARPERYRALTEGWLRRNNLLWVDVALHRPNDDYRPSPALKLAMLDRHFLTREHALRRVAAIFEDRDDVCDALREAGFNVFQTRLRPKVEAVA